MVIYTKPQQLILRCIALHLVSLHLIILHGIKLHYVMAFCMPSSSSLSLKCALRESGCRIGYEPTRMSRGRFWRSISREINVKFLRTIEFLYVKIIHYIALSCVNLSHMSYISSNFMLTSICSLTKKRNWQ